MVGNKPQSLSVLQIQSKLVVTQEIACQLEQRNTGFQLGQFKKVM
jgi:hypothetical protein